MFLFGLFQLCTKSYLIQAFPQSTLGTGNGEIFESFADFFSVQAEKQISTIKKRIRDFLFKQNKESSGNFILVPSLKYGQVLFL